MAGEQIRRMRKDLGNALRLNAPAVDEAWGKARARSRDYDNTRLRSYMAFT